MKKQRQAKRGEKSVTADTLLLDELELPRSGTHHENEDGSEEQDDGAEQEVAQLIQELEQERELKWQLLQQYSETVAKINDEFDELLRLKFQLEDEGDRILVTGVEDAQYLGKGLEGALQLINKRTSIKQQKSS